MLQIIISEMLDVYVKNCVKENNNLSSLIIFKMHMVAKVIAGLFVLFASTCKIALNVYVYVVL